MRVLRSVLYGYAGAIFAGLLVAVAGVGFELSQETVISSATIFGAIFGAAGLSLTWWRPLAAARARRRNR